MRIYLDHNATSPLRPEVRELLAAELEAQGGNASSLHAEGRRARAAVDEARERVAAALGVPEEAVIFTSGGTEANNAALLGVLRPLGPGAGLVVSAIEHPSVLGPARQLEREGHPLRTVPVDAVGRLDEEALLDAAGRPETLLVSLMAANNEVGVRFPLERLAPALAEARGRGRALLHVDAVQALGRVPLRLQAWAADLASFSAHKVGGPPGVGVLVRMPGVRLQPLLHGGGQEAGERPGTENAPAIAAAALAIELAVREQPEFRDRTSAGVATLWRALRDALPGLRLVGPPLDAEDRLPNTLNVHVEGIDGRMFVARLDLEGVAASSGSACASGSSEPSHVLVAMGMSTDAARACVRLSLGRATSERDLHRAVDTLRKTAAELRKTRD